MCGAFRQLDEEQMEPGCDKGGALGPADMGRDDDRLRRLHARRAGGASCEVGHVTCRRISRRSRHLPNKLRRGAMFIECACESAPSSVGAKCLARTFRSYGACVLLRLVVL